MADSREIKQNSPSTPEELASQVSEKVSQHLLDEAYSLLKTGTQANFADKNATEKEASWKVISETLAKDGSLSKLSAPFFKDMAAQVDRNQDGKLQKDEIAPMVQNSRNPFYKGMAQEALKNFDIAASLHQDDQAIDKFEMSSFARRQNMPARAEYITSLLKDVEAKLAQNPTEAYSFLHNSLSIRGGMETLPERLETWGQVTGELTARGFVPKLSMAFLSHNREFLDASKNGKFSKDEIAKYENSRSPLMSTFAKYITNEFDNIASIDYDFTQISSSEQGVYERKINKP